MTGYDYLRRGLFYAALFIILGNLSRLLIPPPDYAYFALKAYSISVGVIALLSLVEFARAANVWFGGLSLRGGIC